MHSERRAERHQTEGGREVATSPPAPEQPVGLTADTILQRIDELAARARAAEVLARLHADAVNNISHLRVAEPFEAISEAQTVMAEELEHAAAQAAAIVDHAVTVAAAGAAAAAASARRARAIAAGAAADHVAETAANTATAVQSRADSSAAMVAGAAADAASSIATSVDENDTVAAATAAKIAGIVKATADASAQETALAASMVASAVAAAAAHTAEVEAAAAVAMEQEVTRAAEAVHALATATALEVSNETIAAATGGLAAARESAAEVALDIGDVTHNVARLGTVESAAELASKISTIARVLQAAPTPADLMQGIVTAALEQVPGTDWAGIALVSKRGAVQNPGLSDGIVREVDSLQNLTGQGPYLSVAKDRTTVRVDDFGSDTRWPEFAAKACAMDVRSMLSIPLFVQDETLGTLNVYSRRPGAFSAEAEDIGLLLAAHGALAMVGVEREANLRTALRSRDVIGQAKGILMERQKIGPVAAFQLLVRASQENNRKLTAIAEMVTSTGQELTAQNVLEV